MMTNYVAVIAADFKTDRVVMLRKVKGPAMVVGKLTPPGGKIEPGEHPLEAAVREYKEEAGVTVEKTDLEMIDYVQGEDYSLAVFYTDKVDGACAQPNEIEKVFIDSVEKAVENKLGEYMEDMSWYIQQLQERFKNA